MVVIKRPVDEKLEDELESLDEKFQELKTKISYLRKKGKDTTIAEVFLPDFAPKLRMARATYEKEDTQKLKDMIQDLQDEIKEAEEGSDFDHALALVKDAYESLRNGKQKEASIAYSTVVKKYKDLPRDLKKTIYVACLDIKKRLDKKAS